MEDQCGVFPTELHCQSQMPQPNYSYYIFIKISILDWLITIAVFFLGVQLGKRKVAYKNMFDNKIVHCALSLMPLSCAVGPFVHSFKNMPESCNSLCLGLYYSIKLGFGTTRPFKNIKIDFSSITYCECLVK